MDHNWNVNKEKVGEKYMFSKSSGAWVVKNKFQRSNEEWKFNLIQIIKTKWMEDTIPCQQPPDFLVSKNIAPLPRPSTEDMKKKIFF
jgi:hypothetical protein